MTEIPLESYIHIQKAKTSSSHLRGSEKWALDILMELPLYYDHVSHPKHHLYEDDYILNIEEISELTDFFYQRPSNNEFKVMTAHMTPSQISEFGEKIYQKERRNEQAKKMKELLERLDQDPVKTMEEMNRALYELVVNPDDDKYENFHLPEFKIENASKFHAKIQEVSLSIHKDKLIEVSGWIRYIADTPSERIIHASWKCIKCGDLEEGNEQPTYCITCRSKAMFVLLEKETELFQVAGISENYEDMRGSPLNMEIEFTGDRVDQFSAGDRIVCTGILQEKEIKEKGKPTYYRHLLQVFSARREDERKLEITADDEKEIKRLASMPDVLSILGEKYAPEIIGMNMIKQALILQAVGGVEQIKETTRTRGQIHILLVGDPGLGKSQLLRANKKVAVKSLLVSDASAAGLTAAVTEINGHKVMQAGVLVLANNGIAAIDEFDKMKREDREAIHAAMEQGMIEKSKAGLHAVFHCNTAVLAAANPIHQRFNPNESLTEQIGLGDAILNRFDLIFFLVDRPKDELSERNRALQILSHIPEIDDGFLMKYVSYASKIKPRIPEDIAKIISEFYGKMRKINNSGIAVNNRSLESMIRLSVASSKCRLADEVKIEDVEIMMNLYDAYLKQLNYDLDSISGVTGKIRNVIAWLKSYMSIRRRTYISELIHDAEKDGYTSEPLLKAIRTMKSTGEIYEPKDGILEVLS